MSGQQSAVDRLRNPEYTGENRCMPCTIANAIIAVGLAAGVGLAAVQVGTPTVAGGLAVVVLALGAGSIALRGYLVPGTPTLTKRYFPDWLLAAFDKQPAPTTAGGLAEDSTAQAPAGTQRDEPPEEVDVEETLLRAGALEECADVDDLCLQSAFESEWDREIEAVRSNDAPRQRLLDLLGVDEAGELTLEEFVDAFRVRYDGVHVGRWESEPAFHADVAAGRLLAERIDRWDRLTTAQRGALLNGLRLFLTTCPACGGDVSMSVDTVESCCRSVEVAELACEDCGARLFESDAVP